MLTNPKARPRLSRSTVLALIGVGVLVTMLLSPLGVTAVQADADEVTVCVSTDSDVVRAVDGPQDCTQTEVAATMAPGPLLRHLRDRVSALEARQADLTERLDHVEALLSGAERDGDTLILSGVNLQIVNGAATTEASNGLGNVIIGYNSDVDGNDRSGSHYLVVGDEHSYTDYGGIVAGFDNASTERWASVTGGIGNTASGFGSAISGGVNSEASGSLSSVSGGEFNEASGQSSSVSGGREGLASGVSASVVGGEDNEASGEKSSVTGGVGNAASGPAAAISGGEFNEATGTRSSVAGGAFNRASGYTAAVAGGGSNTASGSYSTVTGGTTNFATGQLSSVSGGLGNFATAGGSTVLGGMGNVVNDDYGHFPN